MGQEVGSARGELAQLPHRGPELLQLRRAAK